MRTERKLARRTALLFIAACALLPAASQAQSTADTWQWRATIYGWFPGLDGETQFPSGAGGPSINVNADELVEDLKMAFMGTLEARHGQWGGLIDWVYADIGDEKSGTRSFSIRGQQLPAGLTANLSLDVKTNILTLAGTYSLIDRKEYSTGVVFGARMLDLDQTLDWAFTGTGPLGVAQSGRAEVSATNWDAIVGVRGRARFGEDLRWFVPYHFDIGAGNSDLTWQAVVGLGYSFGWGDVGVAWRYLDYEFKSGEPMQSLTFNGVAAGVSFKF
jgi:hypothetical protein